MKLGAYDFLVKPFDPVGSLVASVRRALGYKQLVERNRYLEHRVSLEGRFEEMVGTSPRMHRVFALIESVAPTDATVLVFGESGTGKELVASAIHRRSERRANPFVVINCGALAESVIDSELFGHVSGAFTGATSSRRGLFQEASGGTLFLDEVGELPPATQVRLLRVLQEGEIRPVGSNDAKKVNVRVIAATHRDLQKEVKEGRFREDLFYRINVVTIGLPSLRERHEDLAALVWHFVEKHATKLKKTVTGIEPRALELLTRHSWPGNVRELENALKRAVILTHGPILATDTLPPGIVEETASIRPSSFAPRPLAEIERDHILLTLEHTGWRIEGPSGAASSLDLKPATLRSRMQKLGIRRPSS
jgi:two-component system response regulator HydG